MRRWIGCALGMMCVGGWCAAAEEPAAELAAERERSPLEWSSAMADSEIGRLGDSLEYGKSPRAKWTYTTGLLALALDALSEETDIDAYREYGERVIASYVAEDGSLQTYKIEDYNIDMINSGRILILLHDRVGDAKYKRAVDLLRRQLAEHPRTEDGGFWHKRRYPYQMWLDGLYMGAPFYAQYGLRYDEPAAFDDVARQFTLMDRHAYDSHSGLHYHGWDEARKQGWADPETGLSSNFWGRAVGWFSMGLVDTLDFMPPDHPGVATLREILTRVASGVVRVQDPDTGVWWQVLDQGGREGNYLEATASCMFVYSLTKAVNRGYLPREDYAGAIARGWDGILKEFIRVDPDGTVHLTQCCEVSGLGYTTREGRPRDGSYGYYLSEPIVENDHKGVGPFILAGIELERLHDQAPTD